MSGLIFANLRVYVDIASERMVVVWNLLKFKKSWF